MWRYSLINSWDRGSRPLVIADQLPSLLPARFVTSIIELTRKDYIMTGKEKILKHYYKLSSNDIACILLDYHLKMQDKKGVTQRGVPKDGAHSIKDTADDMNLSIGRASQLITIGRAIKESADGN